jgi:hypothetical protein
VFQVGSTLFSCYPNIDYKLDMRQGEMGNLIAILAASSCSR